MTPRVLFLSPDLLFGSRVSGAAQAVGVPLVVAGTAQRALDLIRSEDFSGVIVDLAQPNVDPAALVAAAEEHPSRPRIVAFGPHVEREMLTRAQEARCDEVLTRGQFVENLPDIIARCAGT